jgi:UDP-2-acetamido-2,6-beta-L-arabino-hexul-4-ose reductase
MNVLVTGANGFVGKNLVVMLRQLSGLDIIEFDVDSPVTLLDQGLATADVIFHLAGVNRPEKPEEYNEGNTEFTQTICDSLVSRNRMPLIIFSSSIQAALDNPYGQSKRKAEDALQRYSQQTGARVVIFRLKNVFGKWCRPNYNSAVATFCNNIACDLPISISDRNNEINLIYVDDVCSAMMEAAGLIQATDKHYVPATSDAYANIIPSFKITLGELVDTIQSFKKSRSSLKVPSFNDPFIYRLYATYLSYLEETNFAYGLDIKTDSRGCLAEFIKSESFGQIFVSRTKPGITRGNHYHHTKTEKFLVVHGEAIIRFRKIGGSNELRVTSDEMKVIEYRVSGEEFRVVDIPPGYTHSIENVGNSELVTLFWANQIFDSDNPDTYFEEVL